MHESRAHIKDGIRLHTYRFTAVGDYAVNSIGGQCLLTEHGYVIPSLHHGIHCIDTIPWRLASV